jgi:O-antigen/teichoic acid export membrane protein
MRRAIAQASSRCFRALPFGIGKSEGRDRDRYQRAALTTGFNIVSSGLAFAVLILSVSLTLPYLGEYRFGVWMTISSLAVMLAVLDLGIGNGLVNLIAQARAASDHERTRELITHGVWLLTAIGAAAALCLYVASQFIDVRRFVDTAHQVDASETLLAVAVFLGFTCVNVPLSGVRRVFYGMQQAWEPHVVSSIAYVCSVPLLYWCARQHASIAMLVCVTYGIQVCAPLVLLWRLKKLGLLSFRLSRTQGAAWADARTMLKLGGAFLALQAGGMCATGFDALIVSKLLGASEVAKLAVAQRLFQCVAVGITMLTVPLWSLFADANARGDRRFMMRTLTLSTLVSGGIALVACAGILVASPWLLNRWIGSELVIPIDLLYAVAALSVFNALVASLTMFLNGVGELKSQLVVISVFCVLALAMKIWLVYRYQDVAWIIWSTLIAGIAADLIYLGVFRSRVAGYLRTTDEAASTSAT